jgi:hypothetical protein
LVEGECCALGYNEDDKFYFEESIGWFEEAFVAGMRERDEIYWRVITRIIMQAYKELM